MEIKELYLKLKNAYTEENLNNISAKIISSYKKKQYEYIRKQIRKIKKIINFNDDNINKAFSKLIMLYHPDKLNFYKDQIEKNYEAENMDKLFQLSHILCILEKDEEIKADAEDIAFAADFQAGYDEEEFDSVDEMDFDEDYYNNAYDYEESDYTFFTALKSKQYGNAKNYFEYSHLKDIEGELELSNYDIEDLSGIEYCINISSLNLSSNNIEDISKLQGLALLEEIDLSSNFINDIDGLKNLKNLRIIDLSYNKIKDISPLFNLDSLEYINLIGNKIPIEQINLLREKGVMVVE